MDILLVGPSKSGKTSIQRVVFKKLSPHESFFLPPTMSVETLTVENNPNVQFTIKDFPGNKEFDAEADRAILEQTGAIIYVFDAQIGDIEESCGKLKDIIAEASKVNEKIYYEVFVHKVDSDLYQNDDQKMEVYNDFQREIRNELSVTLAKGY